ncbi:hypothetical protein CBER1_11493 [Cercospora berteroae]|uniref:Uncharacterized protein n=1 Tax=Cercospora berteroae TaxID=357750 RepID=A0A2S6BZN4_9PEZI|nr:hypothetical protein CBER1_11493 [Cercospora berteroae]
MTDSTTSDQGPTWAGFLDLSPELRNRVCEHALISSAPLWVSSRPTASGQKFKVWHFDAVCPSLLASCRQVNQEATAVLYGANTFTFYFYDMCDTTEPVFRALGDSREYIRSFETMPGTMEILLHTIGDSRRHIRSVVLESFGCPAKEKSWARLAQASGLKEVVVQIREKDLTQHGMATLIACVGQLSPTSLDLCEGVRLEVVKGLDSQGVTDENSSEEFKQELRIRYA